MRLYHFTTAARANAIAANGFRDRVGSYGMRNAITGEPHVRRGVWLADIPLDENEVPSGDTLLAVTLTVPVEAIAKYEIVEECEGNPDWKGYREWIIPARLLKRIATIEILDEEAAWEARDAWRK
jgi:hypothetical protein